jgi:YadA head domain repeat (2 copies)
MPFIMKTKLSPVCLVSCVVCLLALRPSPSALSQIPEGFNYQAIARDGTGNPISDLIDVKIAILSDDSPETVVWEEEHTGVDPDEHGLFSIVVGQGTCLTTPKCFNDIDWSKTPLFIRTKIKYGGLWENMGSAKLWSVPYAMLADSLGGPLKKLEVVGETAAMDEALFEVRNKAGKTVFAVYNEGVRIYVGDGDAKGPKGGFAIGGFGTNKAPSQPYFIVNPDTVRIYINQTGKGAKGGFAIGGYGADKTDPQNFLFISDDSVRVYVDNDDHDKGVKGGFAIGGYGTAKKGDQKFFMVSNDSVRIYVDNNTTDKGPKGGFAIGGYGTSKGLPQKLLTVSDDSVRIYIKDDNSSKGAKGGFAIGGFDNAKGGGNKNYLNVEIDTSGKVPSQPRILWYPLKNAFFTGQVKILSRDSVGWNSTATGYESRAVGDQSQAMGYKAIARGNYSTAIGKNAIAWKHNSFAFGESVWAKGLNSYALGKSSTALGANSFAFGESVLASGQNSYAFGKSATAAALSSFAVGEGAYAYNQYSYAFGKGSKTQADYSYAFGYNATASGSNSFAMGESVTASYPNSYAFGKGAQATKDNAIAMGLNAMASGLNSFAINGTASGESSKAFGGTASKLYAFSAGNANTKANGEYSIAMGENVQATGDNSVAIGSGLFLLPNKATGNWAIAIGAQNEASGSNGIAIGAGIHASGAAAIGMGLSVTAQSFNSFVIGFDNEISGTTDSWVETDPLFVVGNGSYGSRPSHNALTLLKNGKLGINISSPAYYLDIAGTARTTQSTYLATTSGYNVGIGTTTPTKKLEVSGAAFISGHLFLEGTPYDVGTLNVERWNAPVAMFNRRSNNDGTIISFYQGDAGLGNPEIGTISVVSNNVSYNAFTGSHYGLSDEHIEEGKLVVMNGNNSRFGDRGGAEILYGISESIKANDPAAMGAYFGILESTKPLSNTNPYLIMAEGNGEMWVVDNGENLVPGDFLISSDIKGHAMKDKGEFAESYIIAKVAEPVDWRNVIEIVNGIKHKKVSVLFTSFVRNNNTNQTKEIEDLRGKIKNLETLVQQLMEEK